MSDSITVKISRKTAKGFSDAVQLAKQCGGTYDPQTKTWIIPTDCPTLRVEARAAESFRAAWPERNLPAFSAAAYLAERGLVGVEDE